MKKLKTVFLLLLIIFVCCPSTAFAANVHKEAPNVPAKIRNNFVSTGGTLNIVNSLPNGKPGTSSFHYSYTKRNGKVIKFQYTTKISISKKAQNRKKTVAHELGHFFDRCISTYNPISGKVAQYSKTNSTWLKFYKEQRSKYKPVLKNTGVDHIKSNSSEFFAQCCADYWLAPGALKKLSKTRYNTMKKITDNYLKSALNGQMMPTYDIVNQKLK